MTKRGRKSEPTALKILRGNPGKRPLNTAETVLPPSNEAAPEGLRGRAKHEWDRLCRDLTVAGLLTVGDYAVFGTYCQTWGDLAELDELIARVGTEEAMRLGYQNFRLKLRSQLRAFAG